MSSASPVTVADVRSHWEEEPCGTRGIDDHDRRSFFAEMERRREITEPYIREWARFDTARGLRVLEVGVGAGTDFIRWARAGAVCVGLDLTAAGVALTQERLALEGIRAAVQQADAERLPFRDAQFDVVYSYGVLHHTPDTARAIREVHRVLKPGGTAYVMLYHLRSWSVLWVWLRQSLLQGRVMTPREAVARFLESPGTKAYTRGEVMDLFRWSDGAPMVRAELASGDTFDIELGAHYPSRVDRLLFTFARIAFRPAIHRWGRRWGLNLLITARKPASVTPEAM